MSFNKNVKKLIGGISYGNETAVRKILSSVGVTEPENQNVQIFGSLSAARKNSGANEMLNLIPAKYLN